MPALAHLENDTACVFYERKESPQTRYLCITNRIQPLTYPSKAEIRATIVQAPTVHPIHQKWNSSCKSSIAACHHSSVKPSSSAIRDSTGAGRTVNSSSSSSPSSSIFTALFFLASLTPSESALFLSGDIFSTTSSVTTSYSFCVGSLAVKSLQRSIQLRITNKIAARLFCHSNSALLPYASYAIATCVFSSFSLLSHVMPLSSHQFDLTISLMRSSPSFLNAFEYVNA